MQKLPEYEHLDTSLRQAGAGMGASEAHGLLCGLLCTTPELEGDTWVNPIMGNLEGPEEPDDAIYREAVRLLKELYHATQAQIEDISFQFTLLLPDEDEDFADRCHALAEWCQGLLSGIGLSGQNFQEIASEEAQEALTDIAQIAQIDWQEEDTDETAADYIELIEYVRMATLLIHADFIGAEQSQPTLH